MANALFAALDLIAKRDEEDSTIRHNYRFIERLLEDDTEQQQAPLRSSSIDADVGVKQLVSEEVRGRFLKAQYQDVFQRCSCEGAVVEAGTLSCAVRNGISVEYSCRPPCLHVHLKGLQSGRKYFVSLDLSVVRGKNSLEGLACPEPYSVPWPNHLKGWQWMKDELHFNLNAPITEHLRNRCLVFQSEGSTGSNGEVTSVEGRILVPGTSLRLGGVKADQEYEPTLRIIELEDDLWPSVECPAEFKLNEAAFLACLLNGVEGDATSCLAVQKYLLVKKSTLMEGNFNFQPRHPGSSTLALGPSLYNCSVVTIPLKPPTETSLSMIPSHPGKMMGRRVDALPAPGNGTPTWQRSERPLVFRSLESPPWTNEPRTCTLPRY